MILNVTIMGVKSLKKHGWSMIGEHGTDVYCTEYSDNGAEECK